MEESTISICPKVFPEDRETPELKKIFSTWPFELDHFQKFAVEGIEKGVHVLITAHTGSGKTVGAEHAIKKFCRAGERVIYTAPIKSLSNQKFHEFTKKYPDISFGILTGDIKFNPEADCVIMTTEILRNALVGDRPVADFVLDVGSVKCVIFDEVHYINDRDRGMVWEETFIRLPKRIQSVMLSATIDRAEDFAQWVATTTARHVWVASTDIRVVPLNHYSWWVLPSSSVKKFRGSRQEQLVGEINDTFMPLKKGGGAFKQDTVSKLHKVTREMETLRVPRPKRKYIFNQIAGKLKEKDMLPAICFVFSRAKVMEHAADIQFNLFGQGEEKRTAIVEKECKKVLMSKLPDYQDYEQLPEFRQIVGLLQKGIAVHHSGMLPVFKEMIEMMFDLGYVKLLFATETFAVGINMPTKTVLFSSLEKFDGDGFRMLLGHECTQMAGRAGRRGLDTVGHVIHLNNLFDVPYAHDYDRMLRGAPQSLVSKFDITFDIVLRGSAEIAGDSMMMLEIDRELRLIQESITNLGEKLAVPPADFKHSREQVEAYETLLQEIQLSKNKKRKRLTRELREMENTSPGIADSFKALECYREMEKELDARTSEYDRVRQYVKRKTLDLQDALVKHGFMIPHTLQLTDKGTVASHINEVARLPFAEMIVEGCLEKLDLPTLAAVLSCFTSVRVSDDEREHKPTVQPDLMRKIERFYQHYYDLELQIQNHVDESSYRIHYDLQSPLVEWCNAETEDAARVVLEDIARRAIFLGEFSKAVLKINSIGVELQKVCELMDPPRLELKQTLARLPSCTLKYVISNQSLYV